MGHVLHVEHLDKSYRDWFFLHKKKQILHDISMNIETWDVYWLLWVNWAWKTNLITCILWFHWYDSGNIMLFGGTTVHSQLWRIGYAPDNTQYYTHLTWMENIIFAWTLSGMKKKDILTQSEVLLTHLDMRQHKDSYVKKYSAGMKKKLGLAISLLHKPDLLIRDEPMSWLDPIWRSLVKELILSLHASGQTILFSTHILPDVQAVCNKFAVLHNWHIVLEQQVTATSDIEDLFMKTVRKTTK